MLLFLENCNPASYGHDANKRSALSNLLASHGQRNNIVLASKEALNEVLDSGLYSENDRMYAHEIIETRREHYQLELQLNFTGRVDFNAQNKLFIQENPNGFSITVGYQSYVAPRNSEASPFITENDNDFEFYKIIADWYLKHEQPLGLKVNFNNILGAGSHCKSQFDKYASLHPFLLCIVDCDKHHPNKGEGSTSSAFNDAYRTVNSGHVVKVLDFREAENLIPIKVLRRVFNGSEAQFIDAIDNIANLTAIDESYKVYFDYKEGLSLSKAIELDNRYGRFWLPLLANVNEFRQLSCLNESSCFGNRSCPTIIGFGDGLLQKAIMDLKSNHLRDLFHEGEIKTNQSWQDLGAFLTSWGCVAPTKVARV